MRATEMLLNRSGINETAICLLGTGWKTAELLWEGQADKLPGDAQHMQDCRNIG